MTLRALTLVTTVLTVLLLAGCAAAPKAPDAVSPGGAVSSGSQLSPEQIKAHEDALPEPVKQALGELRNREATRAVNVGDEVYAVITAGAKPGYAVVIHSATAKGGKIEVTYELQAPQGVTSAPGVSHPYNVMNLGKGKAESVLFVKAGGK